VKRNSGSLTKLPIIVKLVSPAAIFLFLPYLL